MDAVPDLEVTLLLNIQRKRGDTSTSGDARAAVRRPVLEHGLAGRYDGPRVLRPAVARAGRTGGVLHAKAVVADDEAVFITSANLTEAALDRNIEIGLLVRDQPLALSVVSHFGALIEKKMLQLLPG